MASLMVEAVPSEGEMSLAKQLLISPFSVRCPYSNKTIKLIDDNTSKLSGYSVILSKQSTFYLL